MVNFIKLLGNFLLVFVGIIGNIIEIDWRLVKFLKKMIFFFLFWNFASKIFIVYLNMLKYVLKI